MNDYNMSVLINVIGAVESGGQVYGKRDYAAYAPPYKNSSMEHTITLGWAQNYGSEAERLVQMIYDRDRTGFLKMDDAGIANALKNDWVAVHWNPAEDQKQALIRIIDSTVGRICQDEMFAARMRTYIAECEKAYTDDIQAVMMYCEIRHLGGYGPVKRIFDRLGGDYGMDAIMASLVRDQKDTSNNNQAGDFKYWTRHLKCKEFIERYSVPEGTAEEKKEEKPMAHYISNSGSDENGRASGGAAGDQTGREWNLRTWYNRPWSCILRHPDEKVREKIAELAEKAAKNDKIGYDQGQRDTYWQQLQKVGYDPAKITVACEADCSAGVIANVKAVGYLFDIDALKKVNATYTGNMRSGFKAAGFQVLTASKYLSSPDYLLPGDILLNDAHHTATNITKGSKAGGSGSSSTTSGGTQDKSKYIVGSGTVEVKHFLVGARDPQVKQIQRILNALGYKGQDGKSLTVDGDLGTNTAYAITAFQKAKGLKDISYGTVASTTWKLLLNAE